MMLVLRPNIKLELRIEISIGGGATSTIFPEVETRLLICGDYQRALEYIASRKRMDKYRSIIDFLFCELHPAWRTACRLYYQGRGPLLKYMITPAQHADANQRMLVSLDVAYQQYCEKRRKSWGWYCLQVEKAYGIAV